MRHLREPSSICRTCIACGGEFDEVPDELRSDRVGVVFSFDSHQPPRTPFEQFYIVGRAIDHPAAFNDPLVVAAIDMFIRKGSFPVWLSFTGAKKLIYPNETLSRAVLSPDAPPAH
jgi:hypothetical protein